MKRIFVLTLLFLVIISNLASATYDWYNIQWDVNNAWLNDNSQKIPWNGFTGRPTVTLGVQYATTQTPPPPGVFSRDVTVIITSEPHLTEFRFTKVGDPTKYFRAYVTHPKVAGLEIDSPDPANYIPIHLDGWNYWGGNFYLNAYPNTGSEAGYEGIYTTYLRFQIYPTDNTDPNNPIINYDYPLLDETLHYSMIFLEGGLEGGIVTALVAIPYVTEVDVLELQRTGGALTVGAVEFMSNDKKGKHPYKLEITPGEPGIVGVIPFAFHRIDGTAPQITYDVGIRNTSEVHSKKIRRKVVTKDANGNWYDFIELEILNFDPNAIYTSGNYQSRIKITLVTN
ncbi:MAG: hypothetical protein WC239_09920 [Sphaerochaetaceae bacterium]|jgi:hypothetical protein